jgi:hypothetical protein
VGLLTVVAVFAVVALVAWKPAVLVLPGLVAVAALGIFDRIVVAVPADQDRPARRGAAAGHGGFVAGPALGVDPNAPTTAVPRLSAPPTRYAGRVDSPTRVTRSPGPAGPPPAPNPPAGRPEHDPRYDQHQHYDYDYSDYDYKNEREPRSHPPRRPVQPPTDLDVDMATMAIDMRAFLDT